VTVRCTQRLLKAMRIPSRELVDVPASADDWYANLLWFDRRKCLLITHAGTLFSLFVADVAAADLRGLGELVERNAQGALLDEALPPDALGSLDHSALRLSRTASRRILGVMNDDAGTCRYAIATAGGLDPTDVLELNRRLRRNLHSVDGSYATSLDTVHARLTR
jgi:hypothetical protein